MEKQDTIDAAISAVGSKVTYAGSAGSVLSWMTSNEGGVAIGVLVAVIGLAVNVFFKWREDRRQQEEHEERMLQLKEHGHHE
jgi:cytochrome c biogenesis factor